MGSLRRYTVTIAGAEPVDSIQPTRERAAIEVAEQYAFENNRDSVQITELDTEGARTRFRIDWRNRLSGRPTTGMVEVLTHGRVGNEYKK